MYTVLTACTIETLFAPQEEIQIAVIEIGDIPTITVDEILEAGNRIKPKKAPSLDGILNPL